MEFVSKLKLDMERLEREYESKGKTSWSTFKSDLSKEKMVVELTQADFANGTLRITKPCKLVLTQDIQFNPNRPAMLQTNGVDSAIDPARTMDWFPLASQTEYFESDVRSAYHLGFFAAIAIEAEGVIVDLNNYGIGQHKEHALMQQFFANIELSDQPFPVGSGPANFGAQLRRAKKVWIKNGTLGYSAHQNLHGNDAQEILITNVVMKDSTVAGAAFNGTKKVALIDCEYRGTRQDVKVNGAFNEIRLDTKLIEGAVAAGVTLTSDQQAAYDHAKEVIEDIFNQVIFGAGTISDTPDVLTAADISILKNTTGLPDGISYALLVNPQDVAVGAFLESRELKGGETSEIALIRCNFEKVISKPREVMALSPAISDAQETAGGGYNVNAQQRGATGAVLEYLRCFDANGLYSGNVVSDMQLELSDLQNSLPASQKKMLGQINIEPLFIEMKHATALGQDLKFVPVEGEHHKVFELLQISTNAIYTDPSRPDLLMEFVALSNGDIQHHQLKGVIGMRIEGASDVTIQNVSVSTVKNSAEIGYDYEGQGYIGDSDGGQGGQGSKMIGFFGNHTRGVSISACSKLKISDLTVSNVESVTGPAFGIEVKGETTDLEMKRTEVKNIIAGSSPAYAVEAASQPIKALAFNNWFPAAKGLRLDKSVSYAKLEGLKFSALTQPVAESKELEIESPSVKIS